MGKFSSWSINSWVAVGLASKWWHGVRQLPSQEVNNVMMQAGRQASKQGGRQACTQSLSLSPSVSQRDTHHVVHAHSIFLIRFDAILLLWFQVSTIHRILLVTEAKSHKRRCVALLMPWLPSDLPLYRACVLTYFWLNRYCFPGCKAEQEDSAKSLEAST